MKNRFIWALEPAYQQAGGLSAVSFFVQKKNKKRMSLQSLAQMQHETKLNRFQKSVRFIQTK